MGGAYLARRREVEESEEKRQGGKQGFLVMAMGGRKLDVDMRTS
jgi:hypothetical protein